MQSKNKTNPIVSVIVPAYNEEKHIEECLASIKAQTYKKIELIVVDDGSTDSTKSIAKKYTNIFLSQKHQGPGAARNKAAKIAKGEILVFVDSDMFLDKNYISNITLPIRKKSAFATFTKEEYIANCKKKWVICYKIDNGIKGNNKNVDSNEQRNYFRAIRKNSFRLLGGYDLTFGYSDDNFFNKNIKSILAKDSVCYHYNPDTLSDIYYSARWIGRSPQYQPTVRNILRYSIINSTIISIKKIYHGAPLRFFIYKIVFDLGMLTGVLFKNQKVNYAK